MILYYMKSSLATVWDKYILIFMGIGLIPVRDLIEKFGGLELKFSIGIYFFCQVYRVGVGVVLGEV